MIIYPITYIQTKTMVIATFIRGLYNFVAGNCMEFRHYRYNIKYNL